MSNEFMPLMTLLIFNISVGVILLKLLPQID